MSSYRGRTGPNFSEYISNLNTLSPTEYQFAEENDFNNDLAMFTNTDFTNLDIPNLAEDGSFNFDLSPDPTSASGVKYEELLAGSNPAQDFSAAPTVDTSSSITQPQQQPQSQYYTRYTTPIQPAPANGFPSSDILSKSGVAHAATRTRADTAQSEQLSPEEKSRLVAEEDKRRRNTAASARFRVKKKQREQALEKTVKDTQDKNSKLEARITQLEMENKWLKDLITEKNGLSSKEEMAAAYEQHRKESEECELKPEPDHTSGVGTD